MYLETSKLLILSLVIVALLLSSCESSTSLPRAGQPPTKLLPPSMKGYELYSWQVGREWFFTLVSGTNRIKTYHEITSPDSEIGSAWVKVTVRGVYDIERTLGKLPPDAHVVWMGPQAIKRRGSKPGALALPPRRDVEDIQAHCEELGVRLEVSR